jgi:ATP-dependent DNA ligase
VDEAHEGVIIKKPMSTYALGRRVKDWLKWKPEYLKEISGTFDVLIVGGSFG